MRIELEANGRRHEVEIQPGEMLLPVLRRLGLWSVKHGCESGDCGACLVLLDGSPRLACLFPAARAAGHAITTVEGLGDTDSLHPLQRAFLEHGAVQCGFCTPAMLLAAEALLRRDPGADEAAIREALAGVLCRCTGYTKPIAAIRDAATSAGTPQSGGDRG